MTSAAPGQWDWTAILDDPPALIGTGPRAALRRRVLGVLALAVVLGLVAFLVVSSGSARPVSVQGYQTSVKTTALTVWVFAGPHDVVVASAQETADEVRVSARVKVRSPGRGAVARVAIWAAVEIPLRQPLGGRPVLDAYTGEAIDSLRR